MGYRRSKKLLNEERLKLVGRAEAYRYAATVVEKDATHNGMNCRAVFETLDRVCMQEVADIDKELDERNAA